MTTRALPRIRARRTRFDLSSTPLHWVPDDVQATHMMNVLHLLLPPGERWFCDVLREALPLVDDEALRSDVKGFMGQEATHARAHDQGIAHLADHGIDVARFERLAEAVRRAAGPQPFGRTPGPRTARAWLAVRVATIAAIEHFTSVLGTWIVEGSGALDGHADPAMLDLLRWHGAEEVEHRAVAFDLHEHLSGSYALRVATMLPTAAILTVLWPATVQYLLWFDPEQRSRFSARRFNESVERGHLPSVRSVLGSTGRYLRRDHHPSREPGSRQAAVDYLAASPGVAERASA